MNQTPKLNAGEQHLLRLISKGQNNQEGWATVSTPVYPLIKAMPQELVELHSVGADGCGRARLTRAGENVIDAMEWLK